MTNTVVVKRSAVPGKIPTVAQLGAGELAVNTADGKFFFGTGSAIFELKAATYLPSGEPAFLDQASGKILSIVETDYAFAKKTNGMRNSYLSIFGDIDSSVAGYIADSNACITKLVAAIGVSVAADCVFELRDRTTGTILAQATIPAGARSGVFTGAVDIKAGTELSLFISSAVNVANPYCIASLRRR